MSLIQCECKASCAGLGAIVSLILGVIAAFLRITAVITVTPAFLWVLFGIAVGFLAIGLLTCGGCADSCGSCRSLGAFLIGALGTILLSVVLLGVPFAATSVLGAVLVGALIFFFFLTVFSAACLIRARCD